MKTAISLPRNIIYILQYYKHCKNGELFWKLTIFEIFFGTTYVLVNISINIAQRGTTYQLLLCPAMRLVCLTVRLMPAVYFKYLSYLCFIHYFIYRFIMSDNFQLSYFPIFITLEPMDIEGEVACAVCPT